MLDSLFKVKTKQENACGLDVVSDVKPLKILKGEISIDAEPTTTMELDNEVGYKLSLCDAIDISLENATVTDFLNGTDKATVQVYNSKRYEGDNIRMVQWSSSNRSLDVYVNVATGNITGIKDKTTTDMNVNITPGTGGGGGGGTGSLHVIVHNKITGDLLPAHMSVRDSSDIERGVTKSDDDDHTFGNLAVTGNSYTLKVSKENFKGQNISPITIVKDTTKTIYVDLVPGTGVEGEAILTIWKPYYIGEGIRMYIDHAKVYIDDKLEGEFTWEVSKLELSVDIGTHTITLKARGFNDKSITKDIPYDQLIDAQEMTRIHAATIVDPSTYPTEFNIGYMELCPITVVNASDSDATFKVSQIFEGIDVIYTMEFPSREVYVSAGGEKTVNIPVNHTRRGSTPGHGRCELRNLH